MFKSNKQHEIDTLKNKIRELNQAKTNHLGVILRKEHYIGQLETANDLLAREGFRLKKIIKEAINV